MNDAIQRPLRVFVSYSHDSASHADRVLALGNRLRAEGVDCALDQYEPAPPEGWPRWMERQIHAAAFVLLVCTETYNRRVIGDEEPGKGHGVLWESNLIYNLLYAAGTVDPRFVPVVFDRDDAVNIPTPLQGLTHYNINDEGGYDALYRYMTGQPDVLKPNLGSRRTLPPRERKSVQDEENGTDAPSPSEAAASALKHYLDEGKRIRAHALVTEETRRLHDSVADAHFPINGVPVTPDTFRMRVAEYERLSATVLSLMVAGCYWGQRDHEALWRQCVETLAGEPQRLGGSVAWMYLGSYPALLAWYAGGLAAMAADNYDNLASLWIRASTWRQDSELPLVEALSSHRVFYDESAHWLSPTRGTTLYAPASDHLHAALRDTLREYTPQQEQYDKLFDRFEVLLTLVYGDETSQRGYGTWPRFGRFASRAKHARNSGYYDAVAALRAEVTAAGDQWNPLQAKLFGGSLERFMTTFADFTATLERVTAGWV